MPAASAQDHDIVILNDRVRAPESFCDAVTNVGIKDGRIAGITKHPINGKTAPPLTMGRFETHRVTTESSAYILKKVCQKRAMPMRLYIPDILAPLKKEGA